MQQNSPKTIHRWSMYDWANSVYSLVITSTIFPVYFNAVVVNDAGGDIISFFGFQLRNSVLYSYAISLSFLIVALISPLLSGIADYTNRKKAFLRFFCYMGALACCILFFFKQETRNLGIFMFVLASIGYSGSIVFYNAFLPEVATPVEQDRVSAKGFTYGYIGSVLLLLFNISMLEMPAYYGNISSGMASRVSFLTVGVWWMLFGAYSLNGLSDLKNKKMKPGLRVLHTKMQTTDRFKPVPEKCFKTILLKAKLHTAWYGWVFQGYRELKMVFRELLGISAMKKFLPAFFFYSMGVQTVMYVAAIFADKELNMASSALIMTILIIQIVAIGGAYLFSISSGKIGNINTLLIIVLIWIGVCIGAYWVQSAMQFYVLSACTGLVMGGVQSLSRSTYSKLIPAKTLDHASYFSFYDVLEKTGIVLGTFSYGLIENLTGNVRNSVLALVLYFVLGLLMLMQLKNSSRKDKGAAGR